jgi:hypothetical protein
VEAKDLFEEVGLGVHGEALDSRIGKAGKADPEFSGVAVDFHVLDALDVGALKCISHAEEGSELADADAVLRAECSVAWVIQAGAGMAVVAGDEGDQGDVEAVEALVLLSASKTMFNAPAVEVMAWLMTMELAALNAKFTPEVPVDFVMAESMVMLPKLPEPEKVVIVTLVPALSRPLMESVEMVDRPSLLPLMLVPLAVIKTSVGSNNHSPARPLTDMADPETPSVISV